MKSRSNVFSKERASERKTTVGVRELKSRLSHYLRLVKSGRRLGVTERGETIAFLWPAGRDPSLEHLQDLVREGAARWNGGKPAGSPSPIRTKGRPVSEIVIEERR
jgi:antitoxin (DNA-binding transcriptional repressor) of toxin-antitoxin stability system